jgi:hypothetical protein
MGCVDLSGDDERERRFEVTVDFEQLLAAEERDEKMLSTSGM